MFLAAALSLIACRTPESEYDRLKQEVDRGEFSSTLVKVDAALRKYESRDSLWAWRFRILKARILVSRSEAGKALALLQPEAPSSLSNTEIPEQRMLFLGIAHRYAQQFPEAESDFEEAARLTQSLAPLYTSQLLIAQAALWVDERQYDRAQANYQKALALARTNSLPSMEAAALADFARLTTTQAHFDEAVDLYFAALELAQSRKSKGNTATIFGNLGWTYFELGDFENALKYFNQGAEASANSNLPVYSAYWFAGVADSYLALHDYVHAEESARSTLESAKTLKNAQTSTECLNTLTEVMFKTGRLNEAKRYNLEAQKIEESGKDKFGVPDTLIWAGHIAVEEKRFGDADQFFKRVLSVISTEDAPLRWQAEAGMAGVRAEEGKPAEAERMYLQAIDTIEKARGSVEHEELRLSFLSSGIGVYSQYIDFLIGRGRPGDALKEAELSRARTLTEGLSAGEKTGSRTASRMTPQQLAQRVGATLLFYWLGEKHSYLWVITKGKTDYFKLPPAPEIDKLVASHQDAVVGSKDILGTDAKGTAEKLFATLIAPAQKAIPEKGRIVLLPDTTLYGLNFETLIVPGAKPHYWIEDVTLTTANSLTMLANSGRDRTETKGAKLLLIGNTKQANPEFPPLIQSPIEMRKVEHYFAEGQRTVLEREQATPGAYLNGSPERFSYVHFSTHGTASRTRPLDSAVILSRDGETYKLYARDIVTRHLRAELVTISACYGSGQRAYSGEGLVGLSWAFLHAGAHKVIGALWEVADASSTSDLMDALYKGLNQGKDPATALRDAKLMLLHSRNAFAKPFYWAPFQLYAGS